MKVQRLLQLLCVLLRLALLRHMYCTVCCPQALPIVARLAIQCDNLTCRIVILTGVYWD
jgi:hypothetical protein